MRTLIVACRTISDELNLAIEETNCDFPVLWIQSGLHLDPNSLKKRLQEELEHLSNIDQVLLAFGFCGNSLLGITPPSFRMIFPRVDDCITLMLGSCKRRKEISEEMGTYFLTKDWLDYEKNILAEYKEMVKCRGKSYADRVYEVLLQHYNRLGIIATGAYDVKELFERTEAMAKDLNLNLQSIPGSIGYIKKLLTGPWDEDFIIIQPGETVSLDHLYG